ncbi:MAG TPA: MFS transporter [Ornithinibacter sp.]|nr:MFS transporter [Ornithinibacter sp.]
MTAATTTAGTTTTDAGRWRPLYLLAAAQFIMVLDTSVMNVSISQLVEDFDTEVSTIQAVITLYALVMAAFMILGGKLGDLWGRRRAWSVGLAVYGLGSFLTAISWSVPALVLGWSVVEGLGAALVLPALAALVAGNYRGKDRAAAYAVIGAVAGAGVAVGPLLGGWVTSNLSWRYVFAGETVVVIGILVVRRWVSEGPAARRPQLDGVGAALSALGMALVVWGVLQSATWGLLEPRDSPVTPFGFSLTLFVVAAGFAVLWLFARWQARRVSRDEDPLLDMSLLDILPLRSGLTVLLAQQLVLMGIFFVIPLYLQVVQGFDAFATGLRLLPVSVTMLVGAGVGPVLGRTIGARTLCRAGLLILLAAALYLLTTIQPVIDGTNFAIGMAILGLGIGLLASQLGNVIQSTVGEEARGEVGGLQFTAQNLGASLGTAFIGSIVVGALATSAAKGVAADPAISAAVKDAVGVQLESGVEFMSVSAVEQALTAAAVPAAEAQALLEQYAAAQLVGLKTALLAVGAISLLSLVFTRNLPTRPMTSPTAVTDAEESPEEAAAA